MAKRGMGWIPDYPDVQTPKLRDYQAIAERVRLNQQKLQHDPAEKLQDQISELHHLVKTLEGKLDALHQQERLQAHHSNPAQPAKHQADAASDRERRIVFLLSNYEPRILSRGMQSQCVEELQRNLELLGYGQKGDRPGYFGPATEACVRRFQKHQKFDPSGAVSPVMGAELTALAEIATNQLQRMFYENSYGPGILYIEQQLQSLGFAVEQTSYFRDKTLHAIHEFQTSKFFKSRAYITANPKETGAIGPFTRRALRDLLAIKQKDPKLTHNELLSSEKESLNISIIPFERPLSAKTFAAVQGCLYRILCETYPRGETAIATALGGEEEIRKYLRNSDPKLLTDLEDQIKQRVAPLIEVVTRLILGNVTVPDSATPSVSAQFLEMLEADPFELSEEHTEQLTPLVRDAFEQLQHVYPQDGQKPDPKAEASSTPLKDLTDWAERGVGYFISFPFRFNQIYRRGMSSVAVTYLQELLHALGFYNAPVTGVFEKLTEEALKQFQKLEKISEKTPTSTQTRRIDVDGIVGLDTRTKLAAYKQEKFYFLKSTISSAIATEILAGLGDYPVILCIEKTLQTLMDITSKEPVNPQQVADCYQKLITSLDKIKTAIASSKNTEYASSDSYEAGNWIDHADRQSSQLMAALQHEVNRVRGEKPAAPPTADFEDVDLDSLPDQLRQLAVLYLQVMLYPLIVVVSQLLAPMGSHPSPSQGAIVGLQRLKQVAQRSIVEEIVQSRCPKQSQSDAKRTIIWHRQFQAFIASRRLQSHSPVALEEERLHEFQPLVEQAIAETFSLCSNDLKPALQTFLYQDLIDLLEDFQHSVQWQAKTTGQPEEAGSLAQLTADILTIIHSPKQTLQTSQHTPLAERTFVRLETSSPGRGAIAKLQTPVISNLYHHIQHSGTHQPDQSRCTNYLGLPKFVDLSQWCSPVRDQGTLDACTAHAGVALTEFFEKKSSKKVTPLSSRFLYKVTRLLMHQAGDSGASIRETMKALVYFGVPPEEYCPYDETMFDEDPDAFCYAFAQNYQTISYFRLDDPLLTANELLAQIKTVLAAGFPCMFGFSVYDSLSSSRDRHGHIPCPTPTSEREGGHAAIAVGYDDYKRIPNLDHPGALLIKNSWGTDWGCQGYGWLPYDYVRYGLAQDWWSMIKTEWVEKSAFGLGFWDIDTSDSGHKGQGGND